MSRDRQHINPHCNNLISICLGGANKSKENLSRHKHAAALTSLLMSFLFSNIKSDLTVSSHYS